MNCNEVKSQLFGDEEGGLEQDRRVALNAHVAHCAACRRVRDDLGAAFTTWRDENARATLPDVDREWHAVRRKIRGGVEVGTESRPRRRFTPWIALPIGAAAALALTLYVARNDGDGRQQPGFAPAPQVARADSVEVPGRASTSVYVDDKSGWLIVWATDPQQI